MTVRNVQWYDLNAGRSYPIDESATRTDDDGVALSDDVITDLSIRMPIAAGTKLFLSDLCVTAGGLVTAAFSVTDDSELESLYDRPGLVISVLRPEPGKCYMMRGEHETVGGCIVFGDGILKPIRQRFTSWTQSLVCPRAVTWYNDWQVQGIKKPYGTPLTGLIRLKAGNDIEIVKACREIPDGNTGDGCDNESSVAREVIVIRLKNNTATNANVFETYSGVCGRPESNSCPDPQPVEFIAGVRPDCCGKITIEFKGCATPGEIVNGGNGVVVDCGIGLAAVCVNPTHLPDEDGRLPNEYDGDSESSEAISEINLCDS